MLIVGIVLAALLVTVSSVSAATISTDKMDYDHDETVLISGEGFDDTQIQITIIHPDGTQDVCPKTGKCDALPVAVGGAFSDYAYKLNGDEGDYLVAASDAAIPPNTAETSFADGHYYLKSYGSASYIPANEKTVFNEGETVYAKGWETWTYLHINMKLKIYNAQTGGTKVHETSASTDQVTTSYLLPEVTATETWRIELWKYTWGKWRDHTTIYFTVADVPDCEQTIEEILEAKYPGCWETSDLETFYATGTSPTYSAKALVVDTICGFRNPTGWYNAATQQKYELWADPDPSTSPTETIGPLGAGEDFGLYIDSNADGTPPGPTYYTQESRNDDEMGAKREHTKVYKIIDTGSCNYAADYVVAFEDKPFETWDDDDSGNDCEPDYNDVVIELRDASSEPIPEFATIALPALSVLGLFLYFNRRKQRKE